MTKYIIQAKIELEIEAEDEDRAKDEAVKRFQELKDIKVSEEKLVDKNTGYFIK